MKDFLKIKTLDHLFKFLKPQLTKNLTRFKKKNMKYLFILIALNITLLTHAQNTSSCSRNVNFGDISVCLPKISGQNECYNVRIVKEKADKNEVDQVEVLGYYLNDLVYSKVDKINEFEFDDYIKVYSLDFAKGINFKTTDLDQMSDLITGNSKLTGWEKVIKEINNLNSSFSFNNPIFVEKYTLNDKSRTSIFILGIKNNGIQSYIIGSINTMVIKNRVVFLSYYLKYENSSTLEKFKTKNNELVLKFQKANN